MIHLKVGDKAPLFNKIIESVPDFKERLIIFFYPKDNTPGCTAEACNLNNNYSSLLSEGFSILGISPDNEKSHDKFKSKFDLKYPLIADMEKEILNAYGVWGEKKMYGKSYQGVFRTTFVVNKQGIIERIFEKVETKEHTKQILEAYSK